MTDDTELAASLDVRPISADETIHIRHSVLWPHVPTDSDIIRLPEDDNGLHFGAFLIEGGDVPVAVISLFREDVPRNFEASPALPREPRCSWRFRKFACLERYQGKGVGGTLLRRVLEHAHSTLGADYVWCDARSSASLWYTRRGFTSFGDTFFKHEVEYVRMIIAV